MALIAILGDKIFIVGAREPSAKNSTLRSVIMYITKKECQELAPLPYPIRDMATVMRGDDNVMIISGINSNNEVLNKVY